MSTLDRVRSAAVAAEIVAEPKECWRNAFRALGCAPGAHYVEGFVVFDGEIPIVYAHAWLEDGDTVLDPTPSYHEPGRTPRYFAGARYRLAELLETLGEAGPIWLPVNEMELLQPDTLMWDAYQEAFRAAYGRSHAEWFGELAERQKALKGENDG